MFIKFKSTVSDIMATYTAERDALIERTANHLTTLALKSESRKADLEKSIVLLQNEFTTEQQQYEAAVDALIQINNNKD